MTLFLLFFNVAPLAGAWIETDNMHIHVDNDFVAPLAGAWIETKTHTGRSLPVFVAPLAGAWIETTNSLAVLKL